MLKNNVPVRFTWTLLELGQWKPLTVVPVDTEVVIDVPLKAKYIYNAEAILLAQTGGSTAPKPILTVGGLRYCLDYAQAELIVAENDEPGNKDELDETDFELID